MTTQFSVNPKGSSESSRSLFVSAGRCMAGCHPMANGHASNEPETTRTEPTRAERPASRREAVMADGLQAPSKRRAWKCHSRKLLSDRQTLHLRIAGFGGDGAMPVARCHRRRSMSCCRPSESPGGRERRMLPAALAICAAEFNKFCLSLRARPVTRSCPAPAGPQDGTQGDGRKDRICSAPCGTSPLTRLPHPPRRRKASPRRRGAWQASPR